MNIRSLYKYDTVANTIMTIEIDAKWLKRPIGIQIRKWAIPYIYRWKNAATKHICS